MDYESGSSSVEDEENGFSGVDGDETRDSSEDVQDDESEQRNLPDSVSMFSIDQKDSSATTALAVKTQLDCCVSFLTLRSKFQKLLSIINQLPCNETFSVFLSQSPSSKAINAKCKKSLTTTLLKLLEMQDQMYSCNSATASFFSSTDKIHSDLSDDAELDTDVEGSSRQSPAKPVMGSLSSSKFKLHEAEKHLEARFLRFRQFEQKILRKWKEKTRLSQRSGKGFEAFDDGNDIVKQIDKMLADRTRLINRTRINRTGQTRLGFVVSLPSQDDLQSSPSVGRAAVAKMQVDEEIFDDSDFYQSLLREILEKNPASGTSANLHLQNVESLRSKVKRPVDTKASKGRKINYSNQEKLMHFMAPINSCTLSEDIVDELYGSLFRKISV